MKGKLQLEHQERNAIPQINSGQEEENKGEGIWEYLEEEIKDKWGKRGGERKGKEKKKREEREEGGGVRGLDKDTKRYMGIMGREFGSKTKKQSTRGGGEREWRAVEKFRLKLLVFLYQEGPISPKHPTPFSSSRAPHPSLPTLTIFQKKKKKIETNCTLINH